jgi:hypothetical protein
VLCAVSARTPAKMPGLLCRDSMSIDDTPITPALPSRHRAASVTIHTVLTDKLVLKEPNLSLFMWWDREQEEPNLLSSHLRGGSRGGGGTRRRGRRR